MSVETINELKIWLEGRFDLITKGQDTADDELKRVRETVHNLANNVQVLLSLNIPEKMQSHAAALEKHEAEIEQLTRDGVAHKSAVSAIKASWAIGGAVFGSLATVALELYKVIHP